MILTIRTDKPEAELALYDQEKQIDEIKWHAHKALSDTLLEQIQSLLKNNDSSIDKLTGIIVYQGPGSFTGLRIGITVANTIAFSENIPIVGSTGDDWKAQGLKNLQSGQNDKQVMPEYGGDANITKPRK